MFLFLMWLSHHNMISCHPFFFVYALMVGAGLQLFLFYDSAASQNNVIAQLVPVENSFGTLPAMSQMSIGRAGSAPSVQYGISSMLVGNKPTLVRVSPLLTPRHLSQRRIRLPARKYHPRNDGLKV
ncbi:nuclear pore complex protein NUP98B-like [Magnolia sinica]|uniref:nuclear pore complex protein NUP98B-like n=1 Tax=Magnolia sinica TaxID=86752 RepID=UPI00265AE4A1|nr:nuclear pore complex protein NUP98B-like [Magnolia sinica]